MDLGGLGRAGTSGRGKAFTLIVAARAISIRRRALTSLSLRANLLFFAFLSRRLYSLRFILPTICKASSRVTSCFLLYV